MEKKKKRTDFLAEMSGRGEGWRGWGGGGSTAAPKDTIKVRARESCEQSWSGTHYERSGKQGVYRNLLRAALLQAMGGWVWTSNWNCFQMQEYQWLPAMCTVHCTVSLL